MSSPPAPHIIALGIVLLLIIGVRSLSNAMLRRKTRVPTTKRTTPIILSPEAEAERMTAFRQSREQEREAAIDGARAKEALIDGVFLIARYARHIPKQDEVILLTETFPDQAEVTLEDLRTRSHALLSASAAAGDELLTARFTNYAAVLERLTVQHPGFNSSTYSAAITYGCQLSR